MIRALCLFVLAAFVIPAAAQDTVVIYRCTDANGAVSMQNDVPCPKGSQQQRRVIETAGPSTSPQPISTPMIPPVLAPVTATNVDPDASEPRDGATPAEPDVSDDAQVTIPAEPPPALFSCRTWVRSEHLSDDPVPTRRCAPLIVSGLDGSVGSANASACQYMTDRCTPVPEEALCRLWRQHAVDTRAALLFGRTEDPAATRVELERIEAIIQASTCKRDG